MNRYCWHPRRLVLRPAVETPHQGASTRSQHLLRPHLPERVPLFGVTLDVALENRREALGKQASVLFGVAIPIRQQRWFDNSEEAATGLAHGDGEDEGRS